ncbi:DUF4760 domain-containing protein, partial [Pseudoalteromonas rubra]
DPAVPMDEFNKKIRIKYVTAVLGFSIMLLLSWFYYGETQDMKGISIIIAMTVGALTILYMGMNIRLLAQNHEQNNRNDINKYTFDMLSKWHEDSLIAANQTVKVFWDENCSKDEAEILKLINEKETVYIAIIKVLNYFELLALMSKNDTVSTKIVHDYFGEAYEQYYIRFMPLIRSIRAKYKSNKILREYVDFTESLT